MKIVFAVGLVSALQSTGTLVPGRETSSPVGSIGGSRVREGAMEAKPTNSALAEARGMIACAVKRQPAQFQQLLQATNRNQIGVATRQVSPLLNECAGKTAAKGVSQVEFTFSYSMMRSLVAEAWMRQNNVPSLATTAFPTDDIGTDWATDDPGQKVVLRMADCLSAKEPQRVKDVLSADPSSPSEAAAFAALTPTFSGCLEQNVTLTTNRVGMRLALASAIDRRSRAPVLASEKN